MWNCVSMEGVQKMICYKCPNCGRTYRDEEEGYYQCLNCRYPLKKAENVTTARHPELNPMLSDNHVIGYINNQNKDTPKCPTCGSANIEKISLGRKAFGGVMFGLFSSNVRNTFQCTNCGYKW